MLFTTRPQNRLKIVLNRVNLFLVQWTGDGVIGKTGNHVPRLAEQEHRSVHARALSHAQLLAGKIVSVPAVNPGHAKEFLAQVNSEVIQSLKIFSKTTNARFVNDKERGNTTNRKIVLNRFNFFLVQWTGSGVIGEPGNNAQGRVALEHNNVYARAPGHAQLLVGKIALVPVRKPRHAKRDLVQVNT